MDRETFHQIVVQAAANLIKKALEGSHCNPEITAFSFRHTVQEEHHAVQFSELIWASTPNYVLYVVNAQFNGFKTFGQE